MGDKRAHLRGPRTAARPAFCPVGDREFPKGLLRARCRNQICSFGKALFLRGGCIEDNDIAGKEASCDVISGGSLGKILPAFQKVDSSEDGEVGIDPKANW